MKLQATVLEGPCTAGIVDVFHITIQDTKDTYTNESGGISYKFITWLLESRIPTFFTARSGGGCFEGFLLQKYKPQVITWMKENGVQLDKREWSSIG